jgi:hypothetical protein
MLRTGRNCGALPPSFHELLPDHNDQFEHQCWNRDVVRETDKYWKQNNEQGSLGKNRDSAHSCQAPNIGAPHRDIQNSDMTKYLTASTVYTASYQAPEVD